MKNGVITGKLRTLEETMGELRSLGKVTTDQLSGDWRTRRAIERDLQVAVEIVVDICQRILALNGQIPAATSAEAVERCVKQGAIGDNPNYQKMVQFRNFVVHRYERVDVAILVDIVNNRLDDFDEFRRQVLEYCGK